jgi:hypothetical protein
MTIEYTVEGETEEEDQKISRDFYFNYTKLEIMKMLSLDQLEEKITNLLSEGDNRKIYDTFEEFILNGYGHKTEDGGFTKHDMVTGAPLRLRLMASPALEELIFTLGNDAGAAAKFIEACFPRRLMAEAKAANEKQQNGDAQVTQLPTAEPKLEGEPATQREMTFEDYSEDILLEMSDEQFKALLPEKESNWSREQLLVAMKRKTRSKV